MKRDILHESLSALLLSDPEQAVYLDLLEHGSSSARVIASRLSMARPSVYDKLKTLIARGLVIERDVDGKAEFALHDESDIERLLKHEEERLARLRSDVAGARETLRRHARGIDPKIRFVSGREAILRAMHDMLWDDSVILKALWPYEEMIRVLGAKNLESFNEKRIRNHLRLRTIWISHRRHDDTHIFRGGDEGVLRRYAPNTFSPHMASTVYGDKVLFISSAAESFGFIVHSGDFAELMSQQFDLLWSLSQKTGSRA